jgi:hypothetical protein
MPPDERPEKGTTHATSARFALLFSLERKVNA